MNTQSCDAFILPDKNACSITHPALHVHHLLLTSFVFSHDLLCHTIHNTGAILNITAIIIPQKNRNGKHPGNDRFSPSTAPAPAPGAEFTG